MQRKLPDNPSLHFASFQRGEESGFTYFFKTLYQPVLQYAHSLIDNEPAAEDIVEESFVKLWEKRTMVQSAASVKPYLFAIVKNTCIDYLNKRKTETKGKREIVWLSETENNPLQEERNFPSIHLNMQDAVEILPPRKAQIFTMFHLQHKSIREIAMELNLSIGSVKNQKSAALEMLRNYFLQNRWKK
ncbi:MAG: RNA polymerase sigma-70 factor [Williamsia sp.]|nr:RNA polymerase sigma-70 factor [Williamsia sp.]